MTSLGDNMKISIHAGEDFMRVDGDKIYKGSYNIDPRGFIVLTGRRYKREYHHFRIYDREILETVQPECIQHDWLKRPFIQDYVTYKSYYKVKYRTQQWEIYQEGVLECQN